MNATAQAADLVSLGWQALPTVPEPWPRRDEDLWIGSDVDFKQASHTDVTQYATGKAWVWPSTAICFLCDIHADPEAFLVSLVASGGVRITGEGYRDFVLTPAGQEMLFVIGGDCLDKGPQNLELLRAVLHLYEIGARVKLLGGNHDLRTYLGVACAGRKDVRLQHLFVRMGRKTLRLLQEVHEQYVLPRTRGASSISEEAARAELFPGEEWYEHFRDEAKDWVSPKKLDKELLRIREKIADLENYTRAHGLSMAALHETVAECRRLFLSPTGEFAWFYQRMELAYRAGSFLFIHAGVDDRVAALLRTRGVEGLNAEYRRLLEQDLFELYHGSIGNCFRTKYRDIDYPFTQAGVEDLHGAGVYAIVHGHRNIHNGQRIVFRNGVLNFECDASVDRNTRVLERLHGPGGAATVFWPRGEIRGISTDHRFIKVFDAARMCELTMI